MSWTMEFSGEIDGSWLKNGWGKKKREDKLE
jgi:hypothetical protein